MYGFEFVLFILKAVLSLPHSFDYDAFSKSDLCANQKNQETDWKPCSLKGKPEMKVMKAMKKLKFWSRKKKKKKAFITEPQLPPVCHCQHHQYYYQPIEPSAPPLPVSSSSSWVEYDHQTHETIFSNSEFISLASSSQPQVPVFPPQDMNSVPELSPEDPTSSGTASYQQYMVPNPVYGVPVVPQQVRRERGGGAFGCVFAIGAHLFRCFFPCFHIRDVRK